MTDDPDGTRASHSNRVSGSGLSLSSAYKPDMFSTLHGREHASNLTKSSESQPVAKSPAMDRALDSRDVARITRIEELIQDLHQSQVRQVSAPSTDLHTLKTVIEELRGTTGPRNALEEFRTGMPSVGFPCAQEKELLAARAAAAAAVQPEWKLTQAQLMSLSTYVFSEVAPQLGMEFVELMEEVQGMDMLMYALPKGQARNKLQLYLHQPTPRFWREEFSKLPEWQQTTILRPVQGAVASSSAARGNFAPSPPKPTWSGYRPPNSWGNSRPPSNPRPSPVATIGPKTRTSVRGGK
eukprot:GHVT01015749.1.p2 GENE.GHVT01015749.1~~GHVT01015749.1.p2  ORF type:complete len:296 (-),score=26.93 GHVT01015749.1:2584-3471(-)